MTLYEEIVAKCTPAEIAEKNYHTIATKVNVGRVRTIKKEGGVGFIMSVLGPINGAAVLDSLVALSATNSAVKWALVLINSGSLDFGDAGTRLMIDSLTGTVLTVEQANTLKGSAEVPDTVSWNACNEAVDKGV
jgi:hypothetical protein